MNLIHQHAPDLSPRQRQRICWRVARGLPLVDAAAAEGIGASDVASLRDDEGMAELTESYRHLKELPYQERRRRLVEMAWLVLECAMLDGDPRPALFIMKQEMQGRRPVEVMARAVVRSLNGKPPPEPMTIFVPPHRREPVNSRAPARPQAEAGLSFSGDRRTEGCNAANGGETTAPAPHRRFSARPLSTRQQITLAPGMNSSKAMHGSEASVNGQTESAAMRLKVP